MILGLLSGNFKFSNIMFADISPTIDPGVIKIERWYGYNPSTCCPPPLLPQPLPNTVSASHLIFVSVVLAFLEIIIFLTISNLFWKYCGFKKNMRFYNCMFSFKKNMIYNVRTCKTAFKSRFIEMRAKIKAVR